MACHEGRVRGRRSFAGGGGRECGDHTCLPPVSAAASIAGCPSGRFCSREIRGEFEFDRGESPVHAQASMQRDASRSPCSCVRVLAACAFRFKIALRGGATRPLDSPGTRTFFSTNNLWNFCDAESKGGNRVVTRGRVVPLLRCSSVCPFSLGHQPTSVRVGNIKGLRTGGDLAFLSVELWQDSSCLDRALCS